MRIVLTSAVARPMWTWARTLLGVGILAWLGWRLGTGPFLEGVRAVDRSSLLVATVIGAVTTACCAWRWRLVAGGLGVRLPMLEAVAACYRSQFLNMTLPGGVVGDVHRAVRHGRDVGDVGLGVKAVVLERVAGHVVQVVMAVAVLAAFPSPVRSHLPTVVAVLAAVGLVIGVLAFGVSRSRSMPWPAGIRRLGALPRRLRGAGRPPGERGEGLGWRLGLLTPRVWAGVVLTSGVVLGGQLATFVLAARVAGSTAPLALLLPLTLFALMAMAVPLHVAGWGLREGAAAWVFGAAGLTATQGVATAVTYGVLTLVAGLPGAGVLLFGRLGARPRVAALAQGEANG